MIRKFAPKTFYCGRKKIQKANVKIEETIELIWSVDTFNPLKKDEDSAQEDKTVIPTKTKREDRPELYWEMKKAMLLRKLKKTSQKKTTSFLSVFTQVK